MTSRLAFEALDRTLRDIIRTVDPRLAELPFGGKILILGGDFRQVLPVVKQGTHPQIVDAAINKSKLWENVQVLKLKINMRVQRLTGNLSNEAKKFSEFLLRIGEGKEPSLKIDDDPDPYINLPKEMVVHFNQEELINNVFSDLKSK